MKIEKKHKFGLGLAILAWVSAFGTLYLFPSQSVSNKAILDNLYWASAGIAVIGLLMSLEKNDKGERGMAGIAISIIYIVLFALPGLTV